jgi:hypothetical protein
MLLVDFVHRDDKQEENFDQFGVIVPIKTPQS